MKCWAFTYCVMMKEVIANTERVAELTRYAKAARASWSFKNLILVYFLFVLTICALSYYTELLVKVKIALIGTSVVWFFSLVAMYRFKLVHRDKSFTILIHFLTVMLIMALTYSWHQIFAYGGIQLFIEHLAFIPVFLFFYLPSISFVFYNLLLIATLTVLVTIHQDRLWNVIDSSLMAQDFFQLSLFYVGFIITTLFSKYVFAREVNNTAQQIVQLSTENKTLKEKQNEIYFQAYYDFLTGLYNRAMMENKIMDAIKLAQDEASNITVFFIDLDNFKSVNDNFGHRVGDFTLFTAATRLRDTLEDDWFIEHTRASEDRGFLARLSGDEFVIVVVAAERKQMQQLARKLVRACHKAYVLPERKHKLPRLSVSVGVAYMRFNGDKVYNRRYERVEIRRNLLSYSDKNMYVAKRKKDTFHFTEI